MQVIQKDSTMDINDAHMLLGHIGKTLLEKSAKLIGWTLTGTLTTCDACAKAKAKAKAKGVTKKASNPPPRQASGSTLILQGRTLHHWVDLLIG